MGCGGGCYAQKKRLEVWVIASLNRNGRGVVNSEEMAMDGYEPET
jgi:hypothetical protein